MSKTKRLEVLEQSLAKKEAELERRIDAHIAAVGAANGQPLNDKRNGAATLKRWGQLADAIHSQQDEIAKTREALEVEREKIAAVEGAYSSYHPAIQRLVDDGTLKPWRKHPNRLFVEGVPHARIIWDSAKTEVRHAYLRRVRDREQWQAFADVFKALAAEINEGA